MFKFRLQRSHIPYLILFTFGILLFGMGILNHYFFRTVTYDYGNYNFAFWDYSHFRISPVPCSVGTFLQDHFSLTLFYFVPVYWLFNWLTHSYTLIIIQYSFVIIAAWYTYKLIRLKSDEVWLGAGVLLYYFLLLGRYTTFSSDVNIATISACFIPVFIYYFEIKKYFVSFIILVLSLLSRENIPIWFVFIFLVLIIEHRKERKVIIFSLVGILISVVYFILLFKVIIPAIESPERKFSLFNYSALGQNPTEAILFVIKHPFETVKLFFINHLNNPAYDNVKAEFYWVYLISGGFILFLRPKYLIWFIPIVAQKVLNDSFIRWGIATYYSIEVVTLLPLSVFLVLSTIKQKTLQKSLILVVCIASIAMTIHKLDQRNNQIPWTLNPSKVKIFDKRFFKPPFNVRKVNELLSSIPPKAKVSASNMFLPHLAQREEIYFFPVVNDAEYIVFSVFDDTYLYSHNYNEKSRNIYFSDTNWEIVASEFPVFLFKLKNGSFNSREFSFNKEISKTDTLKCNYEKFDEKKQLILFTNEEKADTLAFLSLEKSHSIGHSIKLSTKNPYSNVIKIKDPSEIINIQISTWCYCDQESSAFITASCGKDFYFNSNENDTIEQSGWKRLVLTFWLPQHQKVTDCSISLWNSGTQPAYFDDLQIIKTHKKLKE